MNTVPATNTQEWNLLAAIINHSVLGIASLTTKIIIKFDSHENTQFELHAGGTQFELYAGGTQFELYAGGTQFESPSIHLLFGLSFMHLHVLPAILFQTKLFLSICMRTLRTPFIPSTLISISLNKLSLIKRRTEVPSYRKKCSEVLSVLVTTTPIFFPESDPSAMDLMETVS